MAKSVLAVILVILILLGSAHPGFAQHYVTVRPVKPANPSRSPAPSTDDVWISEEWKWQHTKYIWAGGYWASPPYKGASWVHGYWKKGHEGWTWVSGHWARTGKETYLHFDDTLFPELTHIYARFENNPPPGPKDIYSHGADFLLAPAGQCATGLEQESDRLFCPGGWQPDEG